jgi:hypothetical protein
MSNVPTSSLSSNNEPFIGPLTLKDTLKKKDETQQQLQQQRETEANLRASRRRETLEEKRKNLFKSNNINF